MIQDIQSAKHILGMLRILPIRDGLEKIELIPANPIFQKNQIGSGLFEAECMKIAIEEMAKKNHTSIEPNPYIRNRFSVYFRKDLELLDLTLRPDIFYEKYIERSYLIYLIKIGIIIPAILGLLTWIILQIIFP